ncbi:DNA mismatch repair endonuclease MutL [Garciella nitratireducens]|uniref:DNA mismatch repair protein MutL n=1 Tax=Garciella nitratireducens DSM 15102 TaxID=1121911 RepID=A0A1T4JVH0_9FIRM|nr:DNA mismatch repair endonuclease MutL [Garciella nitratireducens]SJZ34148.1 DNA mismatch repair protein MutL [Garciella nitratireducens DSM 15102]
MGKIRLLDYQTTNKIAAGEVITNPASVIKELLENSIDAKSNRIIIEIKKGGKEKILIKDNGVGISADDVLLAFKRHATSKIHSIEDLEYATTLGFRGEALASIASISKIDIKTREKNAKSGIHVKIHGGKVILHEEIGCTKGTSLTVEDIFYNTPARYKYLKKDSIESGYISSIVEKIALSHPEISFRFINEGRQVFHTPGNNDLYSCIYCLYGKKFADDLIEIQYENHPLKIFGYIGKPQLCRSNKKYQIFFVNHRYVKNRILSQALQEAYKGLIMIHKYPVCILNIQVPSSMLDVNVHPAKTEILFRHESLIYLLIKEAIREILKEKKLIPEVNLNSTINHEIENIKVKVENTQQEEISFTDIFHRNESIKVKENFSKNDIYKESNDHNKKDKKGNNSNCKISKLPISLQKSQRKDQKYKSEKTFLKDLKEKNRLSPQQHSLLEELKDGKIIGQIFSTYIIIEIPNGLLFIDQHAAHERVTFNRLKKQYNKNQVISQKILTPIYIDVSYQEYQLILEILPILKKLGFEIKSSGVNTIIVNSVPVLLGEPQNKNYLLEIINNLESLKNINESYEKEEKIISMACKSAIKAHDSLDNKEIYQLIQDLINTEQPYTCPHGRPTIIKVTQHELEKLFKRIQ